MRHADSYRIIDIKVFLNAYRFTDNFINTYRISNIAKPISSLEVKEIHYNEEHTCCCTNHGRMFLTKDEKLKKLKEYKDWLDNESKGVEEAISQLK